MFSLKISLYRFKTSLMKLSIRAALSFFICSVKCPYLSSVKAAVAFELEEQILPKMALLVSMPVRRPGTLCVGAAGNNRKPAPFFHPADKLAAVITFIGQNQLASQVKRFQQSLCHTDVIAIPAEEQKTQWTPKTIRYRMDFRCQVSPAPAGFFVVSLF